MRPVYMLYNIKIGFVLRFCLENDLYWFLFSSFSLQQELNQYFVYIWESLFCCLLS